jgi:hypothetical protein
MTDNTTLDAAIEAAENEVDITWKGDMRAFFKAGIAKLIEGMDGNDLSVLPSIHPAAVVWGYNAALTEIRRRAGIEGDKV